MSSIDEETLSELHRAIRGELIRKLRQSRLAPVMGDVGKDSRPGFTDLGVVTGVKDPDFVGRFGLSLDEVTDADIAALTLYLPEQETLVMALGKLAGHIGAAPEGKTGLPYLDEWELADDSPSKEVPLVWTNDYQDEPRSLLKSGYRIGKSKPSADGSLAAFVTVFVSRDKS